MKARSPLLHRVAAAAFCIFLQTILLHAAGVPDRSFGNNGTITTAMTSPYPGELAIQPDGKIVVVGSARFAGSTSYPMAVRYNTDGSLDNSFGNGGIAQVQLASAQLFDVAVQADGKLVAVGNVAGDFLIVRFDPVGFLDPSFGVNGIVRFDRGGEYEGADAVSIQADGRIIVVGNSPTPTRNISVFRLNQTDGSLDTTFGQAGFVDLLIQISTETDTYTASRNIIALAGGRVLIGASAAAPIIGHNASHQGTVLVMLEPDGRLVSDFGMDGIALYGYAVSDTIDAFAMEMAILANGKIMTVSGVNVLFSISGGVEFAHYGEFGIPLRNTDIAGLDDGGYLALNYSEYYDYDGAGTALFSLSHKIVGIGVSLVGSDIAVQQDGKILVLSWDPAHLILSRYLRITSQGTRIADYDQDGMTDLLYYRPSDLSLHVLGSSGTTNSYVSGELSGTISQAMPERAYPLHPSYQYPFTYRKAGLFRGATSFFCSTRGYVDPLCVNWGLPTDIAVGGDYDGDRKTDYAVFRPSDGLWFIDQWYQVYRTVAWGTMGDKPVPADYDYDGKTDIAVYRPSTGTWWVQRSSDDTYFAVQFGIASDIPLTGDFDGDGYADFTVYRPSEGIWYQYLTTEGFRATYFGIPTDIPVPGDYDGDGRHDIAVYRDGVWYIQESTRGFTAIQWGVAGDVPVSIRYDH